MVDDMSIGTIINAQATKEEIDSLGIMTYTHADQSSALYATNKVTGMQIVRTRTELILNSVHTVE